MPLATIEQCKAYLGPSYTDTSDTFLSLLIDSVQSEIENYCHRHFDVKMYTREQHNVNHKIFTREYPIKSVESIVRLDPAVTSYIPDSNGINNFRIFPGYVELLDYQYVTMGNRLKYVNQEQSYVEISYTAGYDTPPADLSLAAVKLVALEYKESREDRIGIEQESEGAVSRSYFKKETEMPLSISAVLDRYKKVRV